NDIYQSADGAIWIATKQGLDKLNEVSDSFDHFDETDGMASSDIRSILEDDLGNLWLSSVKGLIQYKQQSEYFVNYDKSNRLQGSIYLGASAKSDSGALFFGAIEGLIQVSASNLQNNTHVPKTVITNVWLDDKPIIQYDFPADEPLKLHYKVRSIKIQFAALDFQQSNNNMYSSYLQGFDQDYNMPNHKISAHYTNLSPGRYVFHVKGSNNSGVWSTNDATLEIIITPPWWGVLWIQILLVLSVLGVFYAWHRVRLITLARDKKQLELMVQENSEQLVAAQKQLVESEKNVAISGLVVGVAHEINTPIGISVTAVSHTMQLVDTLLASINNNKLSRTDLINKMENIKIGTELASNNLDRVSEIIHSFKMISVDQSSENRRQFNFLQCLDAIIISLNSQFKKANVTINLSCPDDIDIDSYPGTIIQIVNSLVSNALNHAFDGSQENAAISIIVKQDERWIVMDISDNGIGVDDNKLKRIFEPFFTSKRGKGFTGLGLHVVSNLVTFRLGGKITCTSKNGNGCQFNLKFLAEP
ncbi:MAG: ATP-binding protein, partial [Colwellia sp.]|nr:ATP-binding protein [Colwellia sp.]